MRLNYLLAIAGLLGASATGLVGCATKHDVAPEAPCGTIVTVRLCHGMTAMCLTEHTTLELADGTRLRPAGPIWEAYLPTQADGQQLRIGYTLGAAQPAGDVAAVQARLTCLEPVVLLCGTTSGGN